MGYGTHSFTLLISWISQHYLFIIIFLYYSSLFLQLKCVFTMIICFDVIFLSFYPIISIKNQVYLYRYLYSIIYCLAYDQSLIFIIFYQYQVLYSLYHLFIFPLCMFICMLLLTFRKQLFFRCSLHRVFDKMLNKI